MAGGDVVAGGAHDDGERGDGGDVGEGDLDDGGQRHREKESGRAPEPAPEEQEQPEDATDKMNILQYATYKAKKLNKK